VACWWLVTVQTGAALVREARPVMTTVLRQGDRLAGTAATAAEAVAWVAEGRIPTP
jgi:hypothetical protein